MISRYLNRAVIKRRGPGISPGYYEGDPRLLSSENRRKIEPSEIPSCLIPHLLVVFTRQLEILVTCLSQTRLALTSSNSRIKLKTYRLCVPNLVPKKQLWDFPEHRKSFTSRSAKVITLIPSQKIETTKGAKSNIFTCKQCDCISHTEWIFTVIIVIWTYEDLFSFVTSALSRGSFLFRSNNI